MGDMSGGPNTALAGLLYSTLAWQLVVLLLVTIVALVIVVRRTGAGPAVVEVREPTGRRVLRIGLGVLWIIDGLLQAQPGMPSSFVQQTLTPALDMAPGWLFTIIDPFARLWLQHPVAADAVTVWIQLGLGVALLVGGVGRLARAAVIASAAWAGFVWLIGEVLGGLTDPSASWLTGAPGAALLYAVGSLLLLLPFPAWTGGVAARWARRSVGAVFLVGAVLQALPRAGFWKPTGLFNVFSDVAIGGLPSPASRPVQWVTTAVPAHAVVANAVLVTALVIVGTALLLDVFARPVCGAAAAMCLFAWWFGQGLGVFGGLSTDPNTGVILLVLLAAGWPRVAADAIAASAPETAPTRATSWSGRTRVATGAAALTGLLVLPLVAGVGLIGPASAQAAVGDSGGVFATLPEPAPDFTLTDQHGRPLSMRDLRGKLTVVVFLDPECFDSCPLMANQLATSVRSLGSSASSVAILAVDVNPVFNTVADVSTFTREHGLSDLASWHFVTGSTSQIDGVLASFGEGVSVPRVGMIGHPQTVYLFGRNGRELAVVNDTANEDLTDSYVQLLSAELRRRL